MKVIKHNNSSGLKHNKKVVEEVYKRKSLAVSESIYWKLLSAIT